MTVLPQPKVFVQLVCYLGKRSDSEPVVFSYTLSFVDSLGSRKRFISVHINSLWFELKDF